MVINVIKFLKLFNYYLLFLIIGSCVVHSQSKMQLDDAVWKKDAMHMLSERYMRYKEKYDLGRKINSEIDLYDKINDIYRYPFGAGLHKLKEELKANKIVFDSIICEIEQNVSHSNFELLLPAAYYIFEDGKIVKLLLFDADALSFSEANWEYEVKEEMYRKSITKTDNVFYSLLIFTKIYPDWRFEISKITINSHY